MTTGNIVRASTSSDGTQATGGSEGGNLSANGRYLAFSSSADNLVPDDTNGLSDVFVKDLVTGGIVRANTTADGTQAEEYAWTNGVPIWSSGDSFGGSLSADGRYVAFSSSASNLVPGDTNTPESRNEDNRVGDDVYVKDLRTGAIVLASADAHGNQIGGDNVALALSADGQSVAFENTTGLLDSRSYHTYIKNLQNGALAEQSYHLNGLSADFRSATFDSRVSDLVPDDTNLPEGCSWVDRSYGCDKHGQDVFVINPETDEIALVSTASDGTQGNNDSGKSSLSPDGQYVAFYSAASNLVPNDTNKTSDLFVKDINIGNIVRANTAADGTQANYKTGYWPQAMLSTNGRYVVFASHADNLVPDDTNGERGWWNERDVFVKDLVTGDIVRANTAADGTEGNSGSDSGDVSLSADGRYVAFTSDADNLVPDDSNGSSDVFVKDLSGAFWRGERLIGTSENDDLAGTERDEMIVGLGGDDTLDGGEGNDHLNGGLGNDVLEGGAGHDSLYGRAGNDVLRGNGGNDVLSGAWGDDTLEGGDGEDDLRGWDGNDVLYGEDGDDTLDGGDGDDHLNGGMGNDALEGGDGRDGLYGREGNDVLRGNGGNDDLSGAWGDDTFEGGDGEDDLRGWDGNDVLYGDGGDDTLDGGDGNDHLNGGDGKRCARGWRWPRRSLWPRGQRRAEGERRQRRPVGRLGRRYP